MEPESIVQVWFGDDSERELAPDDMYLAVYAAGGGKRNMANFVRGVDGKFRPADVHIYLTAGAHEEEVTKKSQLYICRYASSRSEWVLKPIPGWKGHPHLKLVPEWFKARFWDNKQEKKHPWFMFALVCEAEDGSAMLYSSNAFPVHQYYPTGPKKTDPNEVDCRDAFHRVLKIAPSTALRRELLGRRRLSDSCTAVYPGRSRLGAASADGMTPGALKYPSLPMSPVSSGATSPPNTPLTPETADSRDLLDGEDAMEDVFTARRRRASRVVDDGLDELDEADGDDGMDCEVDGITGYMTPRHTSKRSSSYSGDVGEPIKNIGKSGLDAVQALLALRTSPIGFGSGELPVR